MNWVISTLWVDSAYELTMIELGTEHGRPRPSPAWRPWPFPYVAPKPATQEELEWAANELWEAEFDARPRRWDAVLWRDVDYTPTQEETYRLVKARRRYRHVLYRLSHA